MYHSYKLKRRKKNKFKFIIIILLSSSVFYVTYKYKQHLLFWKYSSNKIIEKLEQAYNIPDRIKRRIHLGELVKICNKYKDKNQISPDSFFFSAKVHFLLGETYLDNNFSELITKDLRHKISKKANTEFIKAVKNLRIGKALSSSNNLSLTKGSPL